MDEIKVGDTLVLTSLVWGKNEDKAETERLRHAVNFRSQLLINRHARRVARVLKR